LAAIGTLDRPHLSGCDIDDSHSELPGCFNLTLHWAKKEQFERCASAVHSVFGFTIRILIAAKSIQFSEGL
jgi:hypothetical protein